MEAIPVVNTVKAREVMRQPVVAATPRASLRDIASQLVSHGLSGMPVSERNGIVIGMVTEADILRALAQGKTLETLTAQDVMSREALTVDSEAPLSEALRLLNEYHILRVPVTEQGKLAGVISRVDIIKTALEPEFLAFGIN
jgi:CBS domain-containing protein